jgi:hypothetical protein
MADFTIAARARAPQMPNIANMFIQRNQMQANQAIAAEKQASAARSEAFRQLVSKPDFDPSNPAHLKAAAALDPTGAERISTMTDNRRKAAEDYVKQVSANARDMLQTLQPGNVAGAQAIRDYIVKAIPNWDAAIAPAGQWTPEYIQQLKMTAEQHINKSVPTPVASFQIANGPDGKPTGFSTTVGGLPGTASANQIPVNLIAPGTTPPGAAPAPTNAMAPTPTAPAPTANAMSPDRVNAIHQDQVAGDMIKQIGGEAQRTGTMSQKNADFLAKQLGPHGKSIIKNWAAKSGITIKPISFSPDQGAAVATAPLSVEQGRGILQAAVQNGVISGNDVQQLAAMAPGHEQGLADYLKQNNVQIQVEGMPQRQNAAMRMPANYGGLAMDGAGEIPSRMAVGAPQYQYSGGGMSGVVDPSVAKQTNPAPGGVVRRNAQAEAQGQGSVDVTIKPTIAGKSKGAELSAQKQADFPKSTTALQNTLTSMDDFINTAVQLKQHPALNRIIGGIDAYTPNFGAARDAQALYDTVMTKGTFKNLQEERAKNPTGGSPVGNASDTDMKLLRQAVGALQQDQTEEGFNRNLDHAIELAKKIRQNTVDGYKREYKGFTTPDFLLHPQSQAPGFSRPQRPSKKVGQFVVTQVSD